MRSVVMMLIGLAVAGCAAASREQLLRRASFDLACGGEQLTVVEIDSQSQGVVGCDKRATYVEECDGPRNNASTSCTWVLNGAIQTRSGADAAPRPALAWPPEAAADPAAAAASSPAR